MKRFIDVIISLFLTINVCLSGCISHTGKQVTYSDIRPSDYRTVNKTTRAQSTAFNPKLERSSLTLSQAIDLAVKCNPDLSAIHHEIGMAEARLIQAKLWPNPTIEVEAEDIPADDFGFNQSENTLSIEQSIPLGGKISARKAVARQEQEIASLQYELALRNLTAEVKQAFYGVLLAQRKYAIARQTRQIAQEVYDTISKRFEARAVPESELIKARVELGQTGIRLSNEQARLTLARRQLNRVLGLRNLKVKTYQGVLNDSYQVPPEEELKQLVIQTYPELAIGLKEKELALSQLNLAKSERYPDIGVRLGYGKNESADEKFTELSVSIPLPIFNRNQGAISEAEINLRRADRKHQAMENDVLLQLDDVLTNLTQSINQAREYRETILPDAEKALELIKIGYQAGKFSHLELLDAQRTLAETREVHLEIIGILNNLAAELEKLIGQPLSSSK